METVNVVRVSPDGEVTVHDVPVDSWRDMVRVLGGYMELVHLDESLMTAFPGIVAYVDEEALHKTPRPAVNPYGLSLLSQDYPYILGNLLISTNSVYDPEDNEYGEDYIEPGTTISMSYGAVLEIK